jgi:hypothetical protein
MVYHLYQVVIEGIDMVEEVVFFHYCYYFLLEMEVGMVVEEYC